MTSAELREHLASLEKELAIAFKKRKALEDEIEKNNTRIRELNGSMYGGRYDGEIAQCKLKIEAALRLEADAGKRRVEMPSWWSGKPTEFVVDKVTPKRIFLRHPGEKRTDQYDHDGKPIGCGSPIPPADLEWILKGEA